MKIQLVHDSSFAPCAFLVVKVNDDGSLADYRSDESASVLVQSDWDFPGLAAVFGWGGAIDCPDTGTIEEASEWLFAHEGEQVEDPGYFA